jgi:uncharacterized protein YceH (UPF0502 family)
MMDPLNPNEVRVLGALLEKQVLTPDVYPLTLNYLVGACNQKTSREPVMELEESEVAAAILGLRKKNLAVENKMHDSRVLKYSHNLAHWGAFTSKEQAALCLLLLRGPQTSGEIRGRAERMASFESVADVEAILQALSEKSCGALVLKLDRRSGEKEPRWTQLMSPLEESAIIKPSAQSSSLAERVSALERQFAELKEIIQKLSAPPAP